MNAKFGRFRQDFIDNIMSSLVDKKRHRDYLFLGVNALLALVALVMSVVNIITKEYRLMISTLSFAFVCILNVFLSRTKLPKRILDIEFIVSANALFVFFIITGDSNGFSVMWVAVLPCFSLLLFGRKEGSIYSLITLLIVIFFFWVPIGQGLLQYSYNPVFLLRFPFFYTALYMISFFFEWMRVIAQRKLVDSDKKVRFMCGHDALTGLSNRYGFYEEMAEIFKKKPPIEKCSVVMADIDFFKSINDNYGHLAGDAFLKEVSAIIKDAVCEETKLCRRGGDEFLMFMFCEHDVNVVCEDICRKIEAHVFKIEGQEIRTTISIGVCSSDHIDESIIEKMIRMADDGLYYAKHNGRNKMVVMNLEEAE